MESMLKDITFEVDNGNKVKRFVVRCMQPGNKHRGRSFGVLDILTNTFVLFQHGRSPRLVAALLWKMEMNNRTCRGSHVTLRSFCSSCA